MVSFPLLLYDLLESDRYPNHHTIIEWIEDDPTNVQQKQQQPLVVIPCDSCNGDAHAMMASFIIHDLEAFEQTILPTVFNMTTYSQFEIELSRYGFTKESSFTPIFFNKYFIRNNRYSVAKVSCTLTSIACARLAIFSYIYTLSLLVLQLTINTTTFLIR
jgi:hypothetical protein